MNTETPVTHLIAAKCIKSILMNPSLDKDEVFDQMVADSPEPHDEALALQWYGEHKSHAGVMKLLSRPQFAPDVQAMIVENPGYVEMMVLYRMAWYMAFEEAWDIIKRLGDAMLKTLTDDSNSSQS